MKSTKVLVLSALGGALEIYDFIIFVFFAWIISQLFFPPNMPDNLKILQSFGIFVTGYIARPVGGIVMAHFADRLGRKKIFLFGLMLMAIPTLLIGLLPTYQQIGYLAPILLLILRVLHGAAIGGEVPGAWVFVAEHVQQQKRGFFLGLLQAGLTSGYLLGALTITLISSLFSQSEILDYAWRIPFILGGMLAILAMYLRKWLNETPTFIKLKQQHQLSKYFPIRVLLVKYRQELIIAALLTSVLTSTVIITVVTMPTILQQFFLMPTKKTFFLSSIGIVSLSVSCIIGGWLSDRIGAWKAFLIYCLLMPVGIWILMIVLQKHTNLISYAYLFLGFMCGVVGIIPTILIKLFPAAVRVSGISFAYNLIYSILGALLPLVIIALMPLNIWSNVIIAVCTSMVGIITFQKFSKKNSIN